MRVAALYDIHGNLPALEAVLDEVRDAGVDRVVVGGDIVPGPMVGESLARLRDLDMPVTFIHGNCEIAVLADLAGKDPGPMPAEAKQSIHWAAEQLGADDRRLMAGWPMTARLRIDGLGEVLFCHATPRDANECFTRQTAEAKLVPIFEAPGVPLVVCGHTHMPFDRTIRAVRVVNAGSVGMPFGEPGADWLLLGPGVELRHTTYDLAAAAARIRATAYPQAGQFAEQYVLHPPTEAAMLEIFARAELA
jgi:putative phosphoesterase